MVFAMMIIFSILDMLLQNFKTKVSGGNVFNICYQPSWKKLDHKACICYVGQVGNMFYPIIPKSDYQPQHQTRATTKGKDIWCEIFLATKLLPPYKLKLKDDSSGSETDEDGEMEKTTKSNNVSNKKSIVDLSSMSTAKEEYVNQEEKNTGND